MQRSADAVLEDVRLERYTLLQARDLYGVVLLEHDDLLFVDERATDDLRSQMRNIR